tara:strand:+ start:2952 stop:3206 length:255 start_codon:yes stop_codon:yes gene_type:complete
MINLSLNPDQEGLDVIAAAADRHNAALELRTPHLDSTEYLNYLLERMVTGWKQQAYLEAADRVSKAVAAKPYEERLAIIASLES